MSTQRRAFGDVKNMVDDSQRLEGVKSQQRLGNANISSMLAKANSQSSYSTFSVPQKSKQNDGPKINPDPDMRFTYLPLRDKYETTIARERELSDCPLRPDEILEDDLPPCPGKIIGIFDDLDMEMIVASLESSSP
ncbi:hypothetical protein Ddc_02151 [Ditylenchus destructor]|nr:hypothetical protein Ddc_02151 [Ditylenchus destructor]